MITILGTIGLALLLTAFILNQLNKLSTNSKAYNVLNIAGGFILTYYAFILGSIPFIILELVWALFASYKLYQIYKK